MRRVLFGRARRTSFFLEEPELRLFSPQAAPPADLEQRGGSPLTEPLSVINVAHWPKCEVPTGSANVCL
jgi:hypothetical protein